MEDKKNNKSLLFRLFNNSSSENESEKEAQPETVAQELEEQQAKARETISELLKETDETQPPVEEQPKAEDVQDVDPPADEPQQEPPSEPAAAEQNAEPEPEQPSEDNPEQEIDPKKKPVDAKVNVTISSDSLNAYIEVLPPQNGGVEVNLQMLRDALANAGVRFGINEHAVLNMTIDKPYGRGPIQIAEGVPKINGVDAEIEEKFSREVNFIPLKKEDGTVDFKSLNVIREVTAGTVLATMTPPTEGKSGISVRGDALPPIPGKTKTLPRGLNTVVSEDGLSLSAEVNGHLLFKDGRFNVESTVVVDGNVDATTGHVRFCGDVVVKGDVREGYEVRSGGSVQVKGNVDGGSLYAETTITINGGYNGMKRGQISCKGNITAKFLQNCTAKTLGNITTEMIINSIVDSDGAIVCNKGKGTIVGGKVTALNSIEALTIGSDVNTPTNVVVGLSPSVIAEKVELEKEARAVEDGKEGLRKNVIYLERCAKMGPLSPKNIQLLESCNKQKVVLMMREGKVLRRLEEVNKIIEEAAAESYIKARIVYPSVKVTIQNRSTVTKAVQNRTIFKRKEGEMVAENF